MSGAAPRVAIIGSGISGLAAAHALQGHADIGLFEAGAYFGGHTHTVDITLPTAQGPVTHGVDTGFLVFNERTYPELIRLFAELDVATARSEMSFSVKAPGAFGASRSAGPPQARLGFLGGQRSTQSDERGGHTLEWSGSSLNSVFAQRRNLASWKFLRMLRDIVRFNRVTTALATSGAEAAMVQTLADFLRAQNFSDEFRDWYFLPMMGCIWSCPTDQMLQFPVATMIRFCHNHGLIQFTDRPQWWTVSGGARHYVEKIVGRIADKRLSTPVLRVEHVPGTAIGARGSVRVITAAGTEHFDAVILAAHSDQSLALLGDASAAERAVLGAVRYQPNRAVLHTDASVLPQKKLAWAAWNYERAAHSGAESSQVCLHYLLNLLQPLPFAQPVLVSLNPLQEIARKDIMGEYDYMHPVFDLAATRAQKELPALQGLNN
ncbi:MAG: NAD(P)-binding protein, partial [Polaromonas sp.]